MLAALIVSGLFLQFIARHQWFWLDEWHFFAHRTDEPLIDVLRPHNEHLTLLPLTAYRVLFAAFGLHSYAPYYFLFVCVHLTCAFLLYRVLRLSLVPAAPSIVAAIVWAFLGSGAENVLWAWQIGLLGSLAFFLAALICIIESPRGRVENRVVLLLLGSLLCSGLGIMAVVGIAAARYAQQRSLVAAVRLASVPVALYLLWFVFFGRGGVGSDFPASAPLLPEFIFLGISAGLAGIVGLPVSAIGASLVVAVLIASATSIVVGGRLPTPAVACLSTLVAFLGGAALLRAGELAVTVAATGRYVHVSSGLLLATLLPVLFSLAHGPGRQRLAIVVTAVLIGGGLSNVLLLLVAAEDGRLREQAIKSRVELGAALLARGADAVDEAQPQSPGAPSLTVARLRELVMRDAVTLRNLHEAPSTELAEALTAIQMDVRARSDAGPASPLNLTLEPAPDGKLGEDQPGCRPVSSSGGIHPVYSYNTAGAFTLSASSGNTVRIFQGEARAFAPLSFRDAKLAPGEAVEVNLAKPLAAKGFLRFDIPTGAEVTLCSS